MVDDLVTVATRVTAMEAYLCKNLLESEGIPAFVADELTGDQLGLGYVHGYVKVQVPGREAERARSILEQAERRGKGHREHGVG